MNTLSMSITYVVSLVSFLLIDGIWLGLIAKNLYARELDKYLTGYVNWTAAIVFYCLFVAGIIYFAVLPAVAQGSLTKALLFGALLGGLCYATYDMTNLATLEHWSLTIVVVDIIWGMILTGVVAAIGYSVATLV